MLRKINKAKVIVDQKLMLISAKKKLSVFIKLILFSILRERLNAAVFHLFIVEGEKRAFYLKSWMNSRNNEAHCKTESPMFKTKTTESYCLMKQRPANPQK